jgi:NodT family efflux transporter outer membrane factor (OMF) lipoprotein
MRFRFFAATGLVLTLGACTIGPDFTPPNSNSPASWWTPPGGKPPSQAVAMPVDTQWWQSFHDPELTSLENRVATNNLDVQIASTRLLQSRAELQVASSALLPNMDAAGSYQRDRASPVGLLALTGVSPSGQTLSADSTGFGTSSLPGSDGSTTFNLWQYSLNASWELDLWGRIRRGVEAAKASHQAAEEERRDVLLSAMAEMAQDYIQLRATQTMIGIVNQNLDLAQQSLHLVQLRYDNGAATDLDMANAKAEVAMISAELPPLESESTHLINAISFLLAAPPRALSSELQTAQAIPPAPPSVPVGLPSELARRRPDIRAAEAELHTATADIGVAVASFYPAVMLNGSAGLQSLEFASSWNMSSNQYSVGPSISLPIFEGGRLRGMLRLSRAQQREAALNYQRIVLQAWDDVDNSMTSYNEEQQRNARLAEAVNENRIALQTAQRSYAEGAVDFLNVLRAQSDLLDTQGQLTQSTAAIDESLVGLYKSLGGGWEDSFPEQTAQK